VEAIQNGLAVVASRTGLLRFARNDEFSRSRGAFFVRARVLPTMCTKRAPSEGGGAPIGADPPAHHTGGGRVPAQYVCGPHPCGRGVRLALRRTRLSALRRGSRQVLRLGSVRSRASWDRDACASVTPGSQLLADPPIPIRLGGGPGEFPNRPNAVCETAPRHRARSTFRIASGMCPSMSELTLF